ncbi:MAG: hypothetical protein ACPGYT_11150 [Nitrospirales bacterium]
MLRVMTIIIAVHFFIAGLSACSNSSSESEANPTQVTLKLGGDNCEFYLGAVDAALNKLKGVQAVDLSTHKGHALVKTDGTLQSSQVVAAVDGLSGEGWKCKAELKN